MTPEGYNGRRFHMGSPATAERSEVPGAPYFLVAFPSTAVVHFEPSGDVS
jgi:hypothetical protein